MEKTIETVDAYNLADHLMGGSGLEPADLAGQQGDFRLFLSSKPESPVIGSMGMPLQVTKGLS